MPAALRALGVLPDRPGRGVEQPRPLRRRPLRPARRRADHRRHERAHATAGLRRRGEAPHHARHLRPVGRLLRRLLRQGAEGPHADPPRDFAAAYEQFDLLLSPTSPSDAFQLRRQDRRPAAMYLNDVCTIPTNLAGHRRSRCPFGTGGDDGLPIGVQVLAPRWASRRCSAPPRSSELRPQPVPADGAEMVVGPTRR